MIHRSYGRITFECDECGEEYDTDRAIFDEALKVLKEEGWIVYKLGGNWAHFCPECKGRDAANGGR